MMISALKWSIPVCALFFGYSCFSVINQYFTYIHYQSNLHSLRTHYEQVNSNPNWSKMKRPASYIDYMTLWLFNLTHLPVQFNSSVDDLNGITQSSFEIQSVDSIKDDIKAALCKPPFGVIKFEINNRILKIIWYSSSILENNNNLQQIKDKHILTLDSIYLLDGTFKLNINNQWVTEDLDWIKFNKVTLTYAECSILTPRGWRSTRLPLGVPIEVIYTCT